MATLEAKMEQILFIKRDGPDTTAVFEGNESPLTFRMPLKKLETYFPPNSFERVHRSYLVNVKMVSRIEVEERKKTIRFKFRGLNKEEVRVGKTYCKPLQEKHPNWS